MRSARNIIGQNSSARVHRGTSFDIEVKADIDTSSGRKSARSGFGFSPVMVAQYWAIEQLEKLAPVKKMYGWQNF